MSIEKMLSHVYEIEGLMLVTRRLGDENTPEVITNKIQRKVRELAEMCGVTLPAQAAAPVAADNTEVSEKPAAPVEPEHLPEDDYDADETWQHDNGEEFKEVFTLDYEEPKHDAEEPSQVPVADREPDEDITVEFIEAEDEIDVIDDESEEAPAVPTPPAFHQQPVPPVFKAEPEPQTPEQVEPEAVPAAVNDEPIPDPDPEIVPVADDESGRPVDYLDADPVPEPEDEIPLPPVPTDFPEVVEPATQMRVDEKLQRNLTKDIRKAFSVNDRFRYQRELFAGSASAMDTAIEHIEVMTSYGNAELYFYSQLHWDRENEVVQDFMNIVRNHFQK
ncbi:MAG: hypothetical protein IKX56_06015 [Muribaculaceae bacterium]|nr:hypothetical protein [Muribaculaceae bacterium]